MDVWKCVFSATRRVIDFLPAGTATLWQRYDNAILISFPSPKRKIYKSAKWH